MTKLVEVYCLQNIPAVLSYPDTTEEICPYIILVHNTKTAAYTVNIDGISRVSRTYDTITEIPYLISFHFFKNWALHLFSQENISIV